MLCSCSIVLVRNTKHTEFFLGARVFQVLNSNELLTHDELKVVIQYGYIIGKLIDDWRKIK